MGGRNYCSRAFDFKRPDPRAALALRARLAAVRCADCGEAFDGPSSAPDERVCPECWSYDPRAALPPEPHTPEKAQ